MHKPFPTYLLILSLALLSCGQKDTATFEYATLDYDTSCIRIFDYDTGFYSFPKYSRPIALTQKDLVLADSLLRQAALEFNAQESERLFESFGGNVSIEYFIIDLSRYKRQYFPYKDSNGQRILKLTCFSRPFAAWKKQEYWRLHGGIEILELRINLTEGKLVDFYTGGYG
jgi:hypothetical protein